MSEMSATFADSERSITIPWGTRELSGEERLAARMIKDAWRGYHDKSARKRQAAAAFIKNGLQFWTSLIGLDYETIVHLIKRNNSTDARARNNQYLIEWQGERRTFGEWAELLGIEKNTFRARLNDWGYCERTFSKRV